MKTKVKELMKKWLLLLGVAAAVNGVSTISSLAASGTSSGAVKKIVQKEMDKVKVGYLTPSASGVLPWIAKESGSFAKYGLDISLTYLAPPTLTAAIIGGDVDVGYASLANVPAAVVEGADLVIIGASYQGPIFAMVGSRNVGKTQNLKGKKIGVTRIGSTTDVVARKVVLDLGMKPGQDVTILALGESASIVAGLQSGAIDAGVLSEPFTSIAVSNGFPLIYDQAQSGQRSVGIPLTVSRKYLKSHEEVLSRFLKANLEAIHLMKTNPEKACQNLSKYMGISDAKAIRDSVMNISRITDKDLGIPLEDLKEKLLLDAASNPRIAKLKPEDLIDLSLLERIKASGFIEGLYK